MSAFDEISKLKALGQKYFKFTLISVCRRKSLVFDLLHKGQKATLLSVLKLTFLCVYSSFVSFHGRWVVSCFDVHPLVAKIHFNNTAVELLSHSLANLF